MACALLAMHGPHLASLPPALHSESASTTGATVCQNTTPPPHHAELLRATLAAAAAMLTWLSTRCRAPPVSEVAVLCSKVVPEMERRACVTWTPPPASAELREKSVPEMLSSGTKVTNSAPPWAIQFQQGEGAGKGGGWSMSLRNCTCLAGGGLRDTGHRCWGRGGAHYLSHHRCGQRDSSDGAAQARAAADEVRGCDRRLAATKVERPARHRGARGFEARGLHRHNG
eukprot:2179204-Rhodomonas_salina.3